jgi:hypothetical protein
MKARLACFVIWFVLLVSVANAQRVSIERLPQQVQAAAANTVVVRAGSSKGSGCYLGDGLFLTAAHVMRGEAPVATVTFPDGRSFSTRLVANDPQYDQALLESTDKPDGGVPVADGNATRGVRLFLGGYSQGPALFWPSTMRGVCSPVGGPSADWITTTGQSIPGDSGGPIFDERGCIIGNLWGGSNGETTGVNCGRTQRFLQRFRDRLRSWHTQGRGCFGGKQQNSGGSGDCYGGYCPPQPSSGGGVQVEMDPGTPVTQPGLDPASNLRPIDQQQPCLPCKPDFDKIAEEVWGRLKDKPELQGPAGPQGPPGKDAEITAEQIAAIVMAISSQIKADPAMRGAKGEKGDPGEVTPEMLAQIKAEVLASLPPTTVVLADGATGKIIDQETYQPGEPIVLDVQNIVRAAK